MFGSHMLFSRFAAATFRYAISSKPIFNIAKMVRYTGIIPMPIRYAFRTTRLLQFLSQYIFICLGYNVQQVTYHEFE